VGVLVVNAGSSSLKLSLIADGRTLAAETISARDGTGDSGDLRRFIRSAGPIDAVGHRIVHGGTDFTGPTLIDERVRDQLGALTDLAPLHQPKSLSALDEVTALLPDLPAVACFDTAFHSTIPQSAATYALPAEWRRRWPLRRFGFHGLSHAYVSRRAADLVGQATMAVRIVSCHLGAGASLAAIDRGKSVDTTMGFTPLEGLVMATRSGSVDPGLVLWLEEHAGMRPSELGSALEHGSGLLGLGGSADLKSLLDSEAKGDPDAALAIGVYLHRLRSSIAAMASAMDGLDVLAFTGGVGQRSAPIRERASEGLGFLGVAVSREANSAAVGDREIGERGWAVRTVVLEAREDLEIARQVEELLGPSSARTTD
jgi:acetate kinase